MFNGAALALDINNTGRLSNTSTTSNSIGGVIISNHQITAGAAGTAANLVIRDGSPVTTFQVSGGTGNISNASTSSNSIGGVVLNNQTITTYTTLGQSAVNVALANGQG